MTSQDFMIAFQSLAPGDEDGLRALAQKVREESLTPARTAVGLWQRGDAQTSEKAKQLLQMLEEAALEPLTDSSSPDLQQQVWAGRTVVLAFTGIQGKIVTMLERMLSDRRTIPRPAGAGPPAEGEPASVRVCDQAYLLMRQILNPQETVERRSSIQGAFLGLAERQKDEEIQKARSSHAWSQLVEEAT